MRKSDEMIEIMRTGKAVDCPICHKGKWRAIGDPETTHCFQCDHCKAHIILTVAHEFESITSANNS